MLNTSSGDLCLKDSNSIGTLNSTGSYIMYNGVNGSLFSNIPDINIYITSTSNAFYHNKFVDGKLNFYK